VIKAVFFDFDGTLFDTSEGIFHTANFTMEQLGRKGSDDYETLCRFVGPPLRECFRITYGLEEEYLDKAVEIYRKEYMRDGALRCVIYPGIAETLRALRAKGIKTGVCTLKYDTLVNYIVDEKGVRELFDTVRGTDKTGTITKAGCIQLAAGDLGVRPDEVLMVGDTLNDEKGARSAGVHFLGVDWGFGYKKNVKYENIRVISNPLEILDYLDKGENMEIKKIQTSAAPAAIGPYSQAVEFGSFVFASGQIPVNPATGEIVGNNAAEQAERVFENIKAVLKEAGTDMKHVVKATVFLKNMDDFASVNAVYAKAFGENEILPARSAVQVGKLPKDVMVEIEVIAVK
jgi:endoribonuclease L-PSP, putative